MDNGKYSIHIGEQAFEEPTLDVEITEDGPTAPGQIFIHELTHVWDAFHSGPEWEWPALLAQLPPDDVAPDATRSWTDLGIEEKALAIEVWYGRHAQDPLGLDGPAARDDEYFPYVRDHIRVPSN